MNTKHTSKTLQERLKRLEALKTHQKDTMAFLEASGEIESYTSRLTLKGIQYQIDQILEELGLEE